MWWIRRDQWPHMKLGPFDKRRTAEKLRKHLPKAYAKVGGRDWTWTVVQGGYDYGAGPE
jgi:hypothetical protein